MIWSRTKLSPEVRFLLDRERFIAVLPAVARARALSRARTALAAGVATRAIPSSAPSAVRLAVAMGLGCMATAAVGAAAFEVGLRARATAPLVAPSPPVGVPASHWNAEATPIANPPAAPVVRARPPQSGAVAVRMELRLVEQARAAVAQEDFVLAIELLAEHAHRFKTGRLVEEREALRVTTLAGLGRRQDARRAAADFEANFPRSPLLSTVSQMLDSAP
jgi:hypothetical protein